MSFNINNNANSLFAGNQLRQSELEFNKSIQKIATGRRINDAADDASGLAIADNLGSQARGLGQAIKNASDGIAIAQIADGALGEATSIIQDIRVKALQAANGSQSLQSRQAIQADIDKSLEVLNDISQNTSFNGQKLLSGEFTDKQFQIGANSGETISLSIPSTAVNKLGDNELGSLADIDVTTEEGAQNAVAIADAALKELDGTRSQVGSTQNQLTSTINNLSSTRINVLSAESTIRDVDIAEESMNMNRIKLLRQAKIFANAQANASAQNIAQLFGTEFPK